MVQQVDFQNLTAVLQQLIIAIPQQNNALNTLNTNVQNNIQALTNQPARESKIVGISNFSGGNQDPISWLEEFTRACNANGTNDARKLLVIPAYLKGPASTWWTMNQALLQNDPNRIAQWTGNNNNTDFILNFVNTFRITTLIEIWTTELEKRQQNLNENVDSYASALQELYRRVEGDGFQYPEAMKAR